MNMQTSWSPRHRGLLAGLVLGAALLSGLLAGCSSAHAAAAGASCGTTKTAVGVPVIVKVAKGAVNCVTAIAVENKYAAMIKAGDVRGNGGGAPVSVNGWTCQGYTTPQILATGDTSQCHSGNTQILAVLPAPTATATAKSG
jgi:hypothetical protein